ncbi:hypothetical protein [Streptomyces noursei]
MTRPRPGEPPGRRPAGPRRRWPTLPLRWRPAVSLRWKISLTVTAVCCAVAAVLGALVHNAVARQTVGQVRKETRADLDTALDLFE